jgi:predicted Zn-dependent protease
MLLTRIGLAALAAVACAWFALGIRQAHDLTQATAIATSRPISRAQAARASSLLSAAGTLNPDSQVKLVRAALLFDMGAVSRAVSLADEVTRQEPMNPVAWQELAVVSYHNFGELAKAFRHIRELSPPVPAGR